jgi:ribonuclease HII
VIGRSKLTKYLAGIDEVGRGPLAGPVCVGLCAFPADKKHPVWRNFTGVKDSKKLSAKRRRQWREKVLTWKRTGQIICESSFVGHAMIDRRGISYAVRLAIRRTMRKSGLLPEQSRLLLDGSLRAPKKFSNQKTIIRGDELEPIIALASIVAKVRRDDRMVTLAARYPEYGFEIHKGYGTALHIKALKKFGPSEIHRRTFIKNIVNT